MNIIKSSKNLDMMEMYQMTKSPEIVTVRKLADGEMITVVAWLFYTDDNSKGESIDLLSMKTDDGQVYVCQSDTFKSSFEDILLLKEQMGLPSDSPTTIKKISGTAKSGREYINCVLIDA